VSQVSQGEERRVPQGMSRLQLERCEEQVVPVQCDGDDNCADDTSMLRNQCDNFIGAIGEYGKYPRATRRSMWVLLSTGEVLSPMCDGDRSDLIVGFGPNEDVSEWKAVLPCGTVYTGACAAMLCHMMAQDRSCSYMSVVRWTECSTGRVEQGYCKDIRNWFTRQMASAVNVMVLGGVWEHSIFEGTTVVKAAFVTSLANLLMVELAAQSSVRSLLRVGALATHQASFAAHANMKEQLVMPLVAVLVGKCLRMWLSDDEEEVEKQAQAKKVRRSKDDIELLVEDAVADVEASGTKVEFTGIAKQLKSAGGLAQSAIALATLTTLVSGVAHRMYERYYGSEVTDAIAEGYALVRKYAVIDAQEVPSNKVRDFHAVVSITTILARAQRAGNSSVRAIITDLEKLRSRLVSTMKMGADVKPFMIFLTGEARIGKTTGLPLMWVAVTRGMQRAGMNVEKWEASHVFDMSFNRSFPGSSYMGERLFNLDDTLPMFKEADSSESEEMCLNLFGGKVVEFQPAACELKGCIYGKADGVIAVTNSEQPPLMKDLQKQYAYLKRWNLFIKAKGHEGDGPVKLTYVIGKLEDKVVRYGTEAIGTVELLKLIEQMTFEHFKSSSGVHVTQQVKHVASLATPVTSYKEMVESIRDYTNLTRLNRNKVPNDDFSYDEEDRGVGAKEAQGKTMKSSDVPSSSRPFWSWRKSAVPQGGVTEMVHPSLFELPDPTEVVEDDEKVEFSFTNSLASHLATEYYVTESNLPRWLFNLRYQPYIRLLSSNVGLTRFEEWYAPKLHISGSFAQEKRLKKYVNPEFANKGQVLWLKILAFIGAMSALLIGVRYVGMWSQCNDEDENDEQSNPQVRNARNKTAAKYVTRAKVGPAVKEGQGALIEDAVPKKIAGRAKAVARGVVQIIVGKTECNGASVGERELLVPYHALCDAQRYSDVDDRRLVVVTEGCATILCGDLREAVVAITESDDLAIIRTSRKHGIPVILNQFVMDWTNVNTDFATLVNSKGLQTTVQLLYQDTTQYRSTTAPDGVRVVADVVEYEWQGAVHGACGTLLVVEEGIIGFHLYGVAGAGRGCGGAKLVSRSDVLGLLTGGVTLGDSRLQTFDEIVLGNPKEPGFARDFFRTEMSGLGLGAGFSSLTRNMCAAGCLILGGVKHKKPARMGWFTDTDGCVRHPVVEGLAYLVEANRRVLVEPSNLSIGSLFKKWGNVTFRVLTNSEIVTGARDLYVEPMDLTTSTGLMSFGHRTRKSVVIKVRNGIVEYQPTLLSVFTEVDTKIRQGKPLAESASPFDFASLASEKDETIEEGKETRVFYMCPLILLMLLRKYFGAFLCAPLSDPVSFGMGVGTNPLAHWPLMAEELGVSVVSLDFKKHDLRVPKWLKKFFYDNLADFLCSHLDDDGDRKATRALCDFLQSVYVVFGTSLFCFNDGFLSGIYGTTVFAGLMVRILIARVLVDLGRFSTMTEALDYINLGGVYHYGDDFVAHAALVAGVDLSQMQQILMLWGYVATDGSDKTKPPQVVPLVEAEFIGRGFRPEAGRWFAPLKAKSLVTIPDYRSSDSTESDFVLSAGASIIYELSMYGEQIFEEERLNFLSAVKQLHLYPPSWWYKELSAVRRRLEEAGGAGLYTNPCSDGRPMVQAEEQGKQTERTAPPAPKPPGGHKKGFMDKVVGAVESVASFIPKAKSVWNTASSIMSMIGLDRPPRDIPVTSQFASLPGSMGPSYAIPLVANGQAIVASSIASDEMSVEHLGERFTTIYLLPWVAAQTRGTDVARNALLTPAFCYSTGAPVDPRVSCGLHPCMAVGMSAGWYKFRKLYVRFFVISPPVVSGRLILAINPGPSSVDYTSAAATVPIAMAVLDVAASNEITLELENPQVLEAFALALFDTGTTVPTPLTNAMKNTVPYGFTVQVDSPLTTMVGTDPGTVFVQVQIAFAGLAFEGVTTRYTSLINFTQQGGDEDGFIASPEGMVKTLAYVPRAFGGQMVIQNDQSTTDVVVDSYSTTTSYTPFVYSSVVVPQTILAANPTLNALVSYARYMRAAVEITFSSSAPQSMSGLIYAVLVPNPNYYTTTTGWLPNPPMVEWFPHIKWNAGSQRVVKMVVDLAQNPTLYNLAVNDDVSQRPCWQLYLYSPTGVGTATGGTVALNIRVSARVVDLNTYVRSPAAYAQGEGDGEGGLEHRDEPIEVIVTGGDETPSYVTGTGIISSVKDILGLPLSYPLPKTLPSATLTTTTGRPTLFNFRGVFPLNPICDPIKYNASARYGSYWFHTACFTFIRGSVEFLYKPMSPPWCYTPNAALPNKIGISNSWITRVSARYAGANTQTPDMTGSATVAELTTTTTDLGGLLETRGIGEFTPEFGVCGVAREYRMAHGSALPVRFLPSFGLQSSVAQAWMPYLIVSGTASFTPPVSDNGSTTTYVGPESVLQFRQGDDALLAGLRPPVGWTITAADLASMQAWATAKPFGV